MLKNKVLMDLSFPISSRNVLKEDALQTLLDALVMTAIIHKTVFARNIAAGKHVDFFSTPKSA